MDRRKSLKTLAVGTLSAGVLLEACNPTTKDGTAATEGGDSAATWAGNFNNWEKGSGRQDFEIKHDEDLMKQQFFTDHELKTIGVLADIIIPADDKSGSASDAGVPAFIEFIVKDMPNHQTPMRGGLRWMDMQCLTKYNKSFVDCDKTQQMELVDQIAWPSKAKPEMTQGVSFFSLMRNLTASGFYSSKIGIEDIGYIGNTPNVWDGVPDDVLKQYGVAYDEKMLKESVKKEDHNKMFDFATEA